MPTRKTTTSTAVKQRYINKTYTSFNVHLRNETFAEIDTWLKEHGMSRATFIKTAFDMMQNNIKSEQQRCGVDK
nr:MAG TPA: Alginate and motility regulator [Caudoviricetes sp.]